MKSASKRRGFNRRDLFRAGSLAAAGAAAGMSATTSPIEEHPEVYTRLGVKPFINATATLTINGGSRQLDEVIRAIEQAGRFHVNLDELMEKAGERLAQLLQCDAAIVTSGAAGALTHATSACIAGADPEKMQQLPDLRGLKNEVIMPKWARNQYDHAIRTVGVTIVEVESRDQLYNALSHRTAMMAMLGDRWKKETIGLDEFAEAGRKAGVPILIDAAADTLVIPDPYLARGASLVAYSGGKILRGPQTAGMLIGRKDLVQAAFLNSAPHHAFGRAMKVSKEEIVGMVTAVDVWVNQRKIEEEYKEWESWYAHITSEITKVDGVKTTVRAPQRGGPFPTLLVQWDQSKVGITAEDVGKKLLDGEPRVMTHASGPGSSFLIRPVALKPGEYKVIAQRLHEVLRSAPKGLSKPALQAPAGTVAGRWDVDVAFVSGSAKHLLLLETSANRLTGTHVGSRLRGEVSGHIDGDRVEFASVLPTEGARLAYAFRGHLSGDRMEGELDLGEHGTARWTARRHQVGEVSRDPSKN